MKSYNLENLLTRTLNSIDIEIENQNIWKVKSYLEGLNKYNTNNELISIHKKKIFEPINLQNISHYKPLY